MPERKSKYVILNDDLRNAIDYFNAEPAAEQINYEEDQALEAIKKTSQENGYFAYACKYRDGEYVVFYAFTNLVITASEGIDKHLEIVEE